ncbi:MAG: hypothetical protein WB626_02875, partial [Bacteroidota bacterium]
MQGSSSEPGGGPSREDVALRARAGLFLDALNLPVPGLDVPGGASLDEWRRLAAKRLARLEAAHAGDQVFLECLAPARRWLQGRPADYAEWVLPSLDYLFCMLARHRGRQAFEPAITLGLFDFTRLEAHFRDGGAPSPEPEDAETAQRALGGLLPSGSEEERDLALVELLLRTGASDEDFVYADGGGFCETPCRRRARNLALGLMDRSPDDPEFHRRLGFALLMVGEFANAIVCFQRQRRHVPGDGINADNTAWCQMKLGWLDEAMTGAREALERVPGNSDVHHDYAALLRLRGEREEALEVTGKALATIPNCVPQLSYLHARLLDEAGRAEEAAAAWFEYLRRARPHPGHRKAILRAAQALGSHGYAMCLGQYPVRAGAEEELERLEQRMQKVRDLVSGSGVRLEQVERIEGELAARGCTTFEAAEERCRSLYERAGEKVGNAMKRSPLFNPGNMQVVWDALAEIERDRTKQNVTFYGMLRGAVKPLLKQITDRGRLGGTSGGLADYRREVEEALDLLGWVYLREQLRQEGLRFLKPDALGRLAVALGEPAPPEFPTAAVDLEELTQRLAKRLPPGMQELIPPGGEAPDVRNVRRARVESRRRLVEREGEVARAETMLKELADRLSSEDRRLTEESTRAKKSAERWRRTKLEAEAATAVAVEAGSALAVCREYRKAGGIWAALTGRKGHMERAGAGLAELARRAVPLAPDCPPLPPHEEDPEAELVRLQGEGPRWLRKAEAVLRALGERADGEIRRETEAARSADRIRAETRKAGESERTLLEAERGRKTRARDGERAAVEALAEFEAASCAWAAHPGRDIVAIAALRVPDGGDTGGTGRGPREAIWTGGLTEDPVAVYIQGAAEPILLGGHGKGIAGLAVAPPGALVAGAGLDGVVRLWRVEGHSLQATLDVGSPAYAAAWGEEELFIGSDSRLEVWFPETPDAARRRIPAEGMVWGLAFDRTRKRLYGITANLENPAGTSVHVWEKTDGGLRLVRRLRGFGGFGTALALDPA